MLKYLITLSHKLVRAMKNFGVSVFLSQETLKSYVSQSVSTKYQNSFAKRMLDNVRVYIV